MTISMIGNGNTQNSVASLTPSLSDLQRTLANGLKSDQTSNNSALLALSDRFSAQIQGINAAILNINDGIASSQIAASGIKEIQAGMERLQELSASSANATLNRQDRQNLQQEADQILQQITSTLTNTQYNGIPLLTSGTSITFQTGPDAGNQTAMPLPDLSMAISSVNLTTQSGAQNALNSLSNEMNLLNDSQAQLGASQTALASSVNTLLNTSKSLIDTNGRFANADIALASAQMTSVTIRNHASMALQAQANQSASQIQNLL